MIFNRPYLSHLVRPWIGWEESLAGSPHSHSVSHHVVLQVVGVVVPFMMVFLVAWYRAGLPCVPPWYVESTAEAHVPIAVVLVRVRCSFWSSLLSRSGRWMLCECQRPRVTATFSSTALAPMSSASSASPVSVGAEVRLGVRGRLEILEEPQLLQGGERPCTPRQWGVPAGGGAHFGDGVMGGVHYVAGAAGGAAHIAVFANACLLAWTSACKVAISCRMVVMLVFLDCAFALLTICTVPITLLMTPVMVLMFLSSSSDNSCAFAMVPGTPTPLPEINRFSYASPKCCFMLVQS